MQIVGIILIVLVATLFFLWMRFQKRQEKAQNVGGVQQVTVLVRGAYDPAIISAKAGVPLTLYFNRQEDAECSRFVSFDGINLRKDLKSFAITEVSFTPLKKGEIKFTCDMGMYQGKVIVS